MRWRSCLLVLAMMVTACGDDTEPAADAPSIEAGASAIGQVTVDDVTIDYVTVVPPGFDLGDEAPVLLVFPPGRQDLDLTEAVVEGTYLAEAVSRGWVVVSPAAPGGQLYFDGSESLLPGLMDWIEQWVEPEGDGFHLAGVSNGGISTFRVAGQNPDRVRSMLVFPGFPRTDADREALDDLADVPVRMFVGANDSGWVEAMEAANERLTELGADVTLEIVPAEGHIIQALRDGVRIFDELDSLR